MSFINIKGVIPPMITPFDENNKVDYGKFIENGMNLKARELYERVFPVNTAVTGKYGIAGLKYACDLLGFEGAYVRKPLIQLKDNEKIELEEILKVAKVYRG